MDIKKIITDATARGLAMRKEMEESERNENLRQARIYLTSKLGAKVEQAVAEKKPYVTVVEATNRGFILAVWSILHEAGCKASTNEGATLPGDICSVILHLE